MEIIFLCIGTDKMTGDCFGPLVGTKLLKKLEPYNTFHIHIYGNLENTISYENIEQYQKQIENMHKTIKIVNCYEVLEFNGSIEEILNAHDKILNTSGEKEITEVFEGFERKEERIS